MSACYAPKPANLAGKPRRQYEYVHPRPVRTLASIAMTAGTATPLLLLVYGCATLVRLLASYLPTSLLRTLYLLTAVVATTRLWTLARLPGRPATADGCRHDGDMAPRKSVAVVGAGVTGLLAAKELQAEGHSVTVFEASGSLGGVWTRERMPTDNGRQADDDDGGDDGAGECDEGDKVDDFKAVGTGRGCVWRNTVSSSSALNSAFSDLPLDSYFPHEEDAFHVTQSAFRSYIEKYVRVFNLRRLIRFNTRVIRVCETDATGNTEDDETAAGTRRWTVVSQSKTAHGDNDNDDDADDEVATIEETFDYLAICTGQVQTKHVPTFEGQHAFRGDIVHVADVADASRFQGKKVVCVGIGESGSDVMESVAKVTNACYLSIRNPIVCLARNWYGVPPDFYETRALYVLPFWARYMILKQQLLLACLLKYSDSATPSGETSTSPSWRLILSTLLNRDYIHSVATGKRTACNSLLVTKTERYLHAVQSGACQLKPDIKHLEADGVRFADGTYVECDTLLLCTGYCPDVFPMFEDGHALRDSRARGRYLLSFDVDAGASVAFLGFCRGQAGSIIVPAEMQARWFALLVSGKRVLPSAKVMRASISEMESGNHGYFATLGGWFLANYIARHHVGCEPSWLRLLMRHGPVVAWRVFTQSFAAYMFRFEGPHCKPEFAAAVYREGVATCGKPALWHVLEVFCMGLGAFFDLIGQIPYVGKLRVMNPLIDRWW